VQPDDPNSVWLDSRFAINHFSGHEIFAGNPIHLVLLLFSFVIIAGTVRKNFNSWWYMLGVLAGFVFLCATLRWQPYTSRYHLTAFVLGAVTIGIALERAVAPRIATVVLTLLLAYGSIFAIANRTRSLVDCCHLDAVYQPRSVLYFADQHKDIAANYMAAAEFVNQLICNRIDFDSYVANTDIEHSPNSHYIYPLFALINPDGRAKALAYSGVHNLSARFIDPNRQRACAVLCIDCAGAAAKIAEYRQAEFDDKVFENIVVFTAPASSK
jgi:hypothetical protein